MNMKNYLKWLTGTEIQTWNFICEIMDYGTNLQDAILTYQLPGEPD